jgi:O-ureido-D-serine cyclo-ligase
VNLRVATCRALPEVDADAAPLAAALAVAGIDAPLLAWDDPDVDWDAPIPTLIRSTWNYAARPDAFAAWIDRVAAAAPLWNPAPIIHANLQKRYLLALAARGVPATPTHLIEQHAAVTAGELAALAGAHGSARIVIKPEVGAGSSGAAVFALDQLAAAVVHAAELARTGAVLAQPYLASVDDYGERSLIFIDGALTHAVRKAPRFAGGVERVTGPFPIADDERAVAQAALAPVAAEILYGRVDVARDAAGQPRVMELELIEPSLFFARCPAALDRLIGGLQRRGIRGA